VGLAVGEAAVELRGLAGEVAAVGDVDRRAAARVGIH
jgi:hypothetical protein